MIAQTLCIARDAAVREKKKNKKNFTPCFTQHPGERGQSLLESERSAVPKQCVCSERRQGTEDLWKGETGKWSGWALVVLMVFRLFVVLQSGWFVFVEIASYPVKLKRF